jgi:hypothetical protein
MSIISDFKTHNTDPSINGCGTSLQGYIKISYDDLVKLFGEPQASDGYKVDAQWVIKSFNGTVITIYNYKDGINYNGPEGTPTKDIINWHIGGENQKSVEELHRIIGGNQIVKNNLSWDEHSKFMKAPIESKD